MSRRMVVLEREPLYREVWAEPVRAVAQRYDLSDVGLRKICQKLGVPLPPLGYWAKVAAGKQPRITPLSAKHEGQTRYVREIFVDEHADERATRVQALVETETPSQWPQPQLKATVEDLHLVVRRTARSMGGRARGPGDLLESRGNGVFQLRVSEREKERALKIVDAIVSAALQAGANLIQGRGGETKTHLEVMGQSVDLVLEEELTRSVREPTAAEKVRQTRESWYKPDLVVRTPSGKLKLCLLGRNRYNPLLTVRCGVATPLEQKLEDVVPRLWLKLIELRIDDQIREEESERWKQEWARKEAQQEFKRKQLDRLDKTQTFAKDWRRAAELREYANALERAGSGPTAAATNQSLESELVWIRLAADCLDPLVQRDWGSVHNHVSEDAGSSEPPDN